MAINLIQNPGFEIGTTTPTGWSTYNTGTAQIYSYPEPGRVGGSSAAIEYVVRESGKSASWIQNVNVDSSKQYTLSGWLKLQNVIGGSAYVSVDWYDSLGGWLNFSILTSQAGTVPWTYFESVIVPPNNAAYLTLNLNLQNTSGKVWFDDLSLTEVVAACSPLGVALNLT
jgi:hypothetical protein